MKSGLILQSSRHGGNLRRLPSTKRLPDRTKVEAQERGDQRHHETSQDRNGRKQNAEEFDAKIAESRDRLVGSSRD
jgi:hypothetical protein